ncbi:MAG: VOC family protein, partial [Flavobacteriaceae bacterium]
EDLEDVNIIRENYSDLEEMKVSFKQLAEVGKITMPLEKQFWNATYGQLVDRFGLHWMMNFNHQQ